MYKVKFKKTIQYFVGLTLKQRINIFSLNIGIMCTLLLFLSNLFKIVISPEVIYTMYFKSVSNRKKGYFS